MSICELYNQRVNPEALKHFCGFAKRVIHWNSLELKIITQSWIQIFQLLIWGESYKELMFIQN